MRKIYLDNVKLSWKESLNKEYLFREKVNQNQGIIKEVLKDEKNIP